METGFGQEDQKSQEWSRAQIEEWMKSNQEWIYGLIAVLLYAQQWAVTNWLLDKEGSRQLVTSGREAACEVD